MQFLGRKISVLNHWLNATRRFGTQLANRDCSFGRFGVCEASFNAGDNQRRIKGFHYREPANILMPHAVNFARYQASALIAIVGHF